MRLAALEQNVERRYLREPLWPAHEVVLEKALLSTPSGAPSVPLQRYHMRSPSHSSLAPNARAVP